VHDEDLSLTAKPDVLFESRPDGFSPRAVIAKTARVLNQPIVN
jgi:hypothetical protein